MQPLAALRDKFQVVGGLDLHEADPGNDGGGDHARANASFLTGTRARKTDGSDIHVGVSVDQVAAKHVGHVTRFPSLELSCDSVHKAGHCDTGYSCAYQYNISWQSPTTPDDPGAESRASSSSGSSARGRRRSASATSRCGFARRSRSSTSCSTTRTTWAAGSAGATRRSSTST